MTKEECKALAEGCDGRTAFALKHRTAYLLSLRRGWMDEVCPRKKSVIHRDIKWTKASVIEEARKYRNITTFRHYRGGAYQVAHRHGWLDDVRREVWGNA